MEFAWGWGWGEIGNCPIAIVHLSARPPARPPSLPAVVMAPPFSGGKADAVAAAATRLLSELVGTAGLTCPDGSVVDAAREQLRGAFTIAVCACV